MTKEIWTDIKGYEGLYQVSNLGRVKSLKCNREKILKPFRYGEYIAVELLKEKGKKGKSRAIHRLVAEAFIDNSENKREVDHINTIKSDNRVENLRWVTPKENMNNPLTRKNLSDGIGKKVICLNTNMIFKSMTEASKYYNTSIASISQCCNNKTNYAGELHGERLRWSFVS